MDYLVNENTLWQDWSVGSCEDAQRHVAGLPGGLTMRCTGKRVQQPQPQKESSSISRSLRQTGFIHHGYPRQPYVHSYIADSLGDDITSSSLPSTHTHAHTHAYANLPRHFHNLAQFGHKDRVGFQAISFTLFHLVSCLGEQLSWVLESKEGGTHCVRVEYGNVSDNGIHVFFLSRTVGLRPPRYTCAI